MISRERVLKEARLSHSAACDDASSRTETSVSLQHLGRSLGNIASASASSSSSSSSSSSFATRENQRLRLLSSDSNHENQRLRLKEAYGRLRRFHPKSLSPCDSAPSPSETREDDRAGEHIDQDGIQSPSDSPKLSSPATSTGLSVSEEDPSARQERDLERRRSRVSSKMDFDALPVAASASNGRPTNFEEMLQKALEAEEARRAGLEERDEGAEEKGRVSVDRKTQPPPRPFLRKGVNLQAWKAGSRQRSAKTPSSSSSLPSYRESPSQLSSRSFKNGASPSTRNAAQASELKLADLENAEELSSDSKSKVGATAVRHGARKSETEKDSDLDVVIEEFASLALESKRRAEEETSASFKKSGAREALRWSARIFEETQLTPSFRPDGDAETQRQSETEAAWLSAQLREEEKETEEKETEEKEKFYKVKDDDDDEEEEEKLPFRSSQRPTAGKNEAALEKGPAFEDMHSRIAQYEEDFASRRLISFADEEESPVAQESDSAIPAATSSSAAPVEEERRRIKNKMDLLKLQLARLRESEQRLRAISADLKNQRAELEAERGKMRADLNKEHQKALQEIRACRQQLLLEKRRVATESAECLERDAAEQERLRVGLSLQHQQQQQLSELQRQVASLQEEIHALRQKNRANQSRWRAERQSLHQQLQETRQELRIATLRSAANPAGAFVSTPLKKNEVCKARGDSCRSFRRRVSSRSEERSCPSSFSSESECSSRRRASRRQSSCEGGRGRRREFKSSRECRRSQPSSSCAPDACPPSSDWKEIASEVLEEKLPDGQCHRRRSSRSVSPQRQFSSSALLPPSESAHVSTTSAPSEKRDRDRGKRRSSTISEDAGSATSPALAAVTMQLLQTLQQQQRLLWMQQRAFQSGSIEPLPFFVNPGDSFGHCPVSNGAGALGGASNGAPSRSQETDSLRLSSAQQESTTTLPSQAASVSLSATESLRVPDELPSTASVAHPSQMPDEERQTLVAQTTTPLTSAVKSSSFSEKPGRAISENLATSLASIPSANKHASASFGAKSALPSPLDERFSFLLGFDFWTPFSSAMSELQRMIKEGGPATHTKEMKDRTESVYRSGNKREAACRLEETCAESEGYTRVVYSNGLEKLRSPVGVVYVIFGNGDIKINNTDGTQIYRFKESDTLQYTMKDGTVMNRFSDGQVECQRPDGSAEIVFSNGVRKCLHRDGRETIIFPDGSFQENAVAGGVRPASAAGIQGVASGVSASK